MSRPSRFVGTAVLLVATTALAGEGAPSSARRPTPLTLEAQGSFFVGGRDVHSDTLSTNPAFAASGTITVDQVYVRYQVPVGAARHLPVTFIHGCCLTGKTWETTPDGRMGWDEFFVRAGHPVYVVDQAWRGRSASDPSAINAVKTGQAAAGALPRVFSAAHEAAWVVFRFGPEHGKVFPGIRFPVEAVGELWKQMVPDFIDGLPTPNPTVPALSELARKLGGTVLVSHSQSGIYPFQVATLSRDGVVAIVAIEPAACPDPGGDLTAFKGLPILVLFGDYTGQSPRWAPRVPRCRDFVKAANAAGAKAELTLLPEIGITGNSHMLMQDSNSLEVAAWLVSWIDRHVGAGKSEEGRAPDRRRVDRGG